jgi:medium-chain acyl-[acyl-carrier-protein] hydrolase
LEEHANRPLGLGPREQQCLSQSGALAVLRRLEAPRLRLFCLPYAGAGASAFRAWPGDLPEDVEVYALEPPGRERRVAEPPLAALAPLVASFADAVSPLLDLQYALFGHSMGALTAFELTRELRRRGLPEPTHLVVSGFRAPHLPHRAPELYRLPEDALVAELRRLDGTPAEVLAHEELLALVLPALRADLTACETYVYTDAPPLTCSLSAWGGRLDADLAEDELSAWSCHTSGSFDVHLLDGGHSYPITARTAVTAKLAEMLCGATEAA